MEFTDSDELRRDILANQYLPEDLRERAKNDTSEYCRAEDTDNLLEVDRLTGNGLIRFYMEAGNGSMQVDVPEETAPKHRPVDPRPYERVKERIMKNIFVLNSVIRLIERNTAHAIRFARIGAALLLIAVGTLVFGACVLLTGTPLVVLFTAFVICSFIGSQLFGGAILVMEEDRRKQPTRRDER